MKTELSQILAAHLARYPLMEPADLIKLLYQNEFGGGHLISDPAKSLAYLQQEWESLPADYDLYEKGPISFIQENIGNGLSRFHLAPAKKLDLINPEQLNDVFVRSAAAHTGDMKRFRETMDRLEEQYDSFSFPFTKEALTDYLARYRDAGCPMVSHSESYRQAYHPAYRVVLAELISPLIPEEM